MKVAALYDVHGNVHALEAVPAELDADAVLFGGDLASGPFPLVDDGAVESRLTEYDLERAAAETRASGHPLAEERIERRSRRAEALAFLSP